MNVVLPAPLAPAITLPISNMRLNRPWRPHDFLDTGCFKHATLQERLSSWLNRCRWIRALGPLYLLQLGPTHECREDAGAEGAGDALQQLQLTAAASAGRLRSRPHLAYDKQMQPMPMPPPCYCRMRAT